MIRATRGSTILRNLVKSLLSPLLQLSRDGRLKFLSGQVTAYRESDELQAVVDRPLDMVDRHHATSSPSASGLSAQPVISILLARLAATSASQARPFDSR